MPIQVRNIIRNILMIFILVSPWLSIAQPDEKAELTAFFVKPELDAHVGELVFNVLRLTNNSDNDIRIKPVLNLPKGFGLYSTAFHGDTLVPAHNTIMLPFRLKTSNSVIATKQYEISFLAFDMNNNPLIEQTMKIKPQVVHSWDVEIPDNKVVFYPKNNSGEFEVHVQNKGNTSELITLDIQADAQLQLSTPEGDPLMAQQTVIVYPDSDTTIKFRAKYSAENSDRVFDIRKVNVYASSSDKKIYRAVAIERYNDEYSPFFADYTLPNSAEVGIRSSDLANEIVPYASVRGYSKYKNASSLQYYYSNYNLAETNKFIDYSNYRFLYQMKDLSFGLGNFSSQLGRNIYSRNAIMLGYSGDLSPEYKLQAFASQDMFEPNTSGAVGFSFNNNKYKAYGSVGFNSDRVRKINTTSIFAASPGIPIYKENYITILTNAYREDYSLVKNYTLQGFAWDIQYTGRIGYRFLMQISNSFGSKNIPGNQMGLLGFKGRFTFKLNSVFKYFTSKVYDIRRRYHDYTPYGDKLPEVYLHDTYANIEYNSNKNANFTYIIGPSFEMYQSKRPMVGTSNFENFNLTKYLIEFHSVIFKDIHLEIKAGLRDIVYNGYTSINDRRPDVHVVGDYAYEGYGIRFNYNYGPLANRGLYQFVTDVNYNGIIASPYINHVFGRGRVNLLMYSNFTYRFDLKYSFANIAPQAEIYLYRNWYLKLRGSYTYYQQNNDEYQLKNSVYYTEVGIKKKFGYSDFYYKERNLRRLKVVCFKDENNNGKQDRGEKGIDLVRLRLKQIDETMEPGDNLPVDITLLTNDAGYVIYNRIPKGFYNIEVDPLGNMQEYFYVSKEHEYVELLKNTTYFIPFQKANKIVGKIEVEKTKFSGEKPLDLENIKVTAYNKSGNSFSSFTRKDGSFTIYAPGDTTYFIRLNNVFGNKYRIIENDIFKKVPDPNDIPVVFNVVEKTRKINFKKVETGQQGSSSTKIKVLKGKIFENTDKRVKKGAEPDFDMNSDNSTSYQTELNIGKYYVILANANSAEDARKIVYGYIVKGQNAYFGLDANSGKYLIFAGEYNSAYDAQMATKKLENDGIQVKETLFHK